MASWRTVLQAVDGTRWNLEVSASIPKHEKSRLICVYLVEPGFFIVPKAVTRSQANSTILWDGCSTWFLGTHAFLTESEARNAARERAAFELQKLQNAVQTLRDNMDNPRWPPAHAR